MAMKYTNAITKNFKMHLHIENHEKIEQLLSFYDKLTYS